MTLFDAVLTHFQYLKARFFIKQNQKLSKKMETKEKQMKPLNTFGVQFLIRQDKLRDGKAVYYGDVDHPVPGQIDHWVS